MYFKLGLELKGAFLVTWDWPEGWLVGVPVLMGVACLREWVWPAGREVVAEKWRCPGSGDVAELSVTEKGDL